MQRFKELDGVEDSSFNLKNAEEEYCAAALIMDPKNQRKTWVFIEATELPAVSKTAHKSSNLKSTPEFFKLVKT